MAKEELTAKVVAAPAPGASITLDFKMATELLKMFGEEPGLVTLQQGSERSHSGTGLYALYSHLPAEGAEFLGAEPDDEAVPEATPAQPVTWQPIATAPRDGTNILIRFGIDGDSQAKYIPGLTHPWKFIDTNDGITWLINHAVDGPGGPSHWMQFPPYRKAAAPQPAAQDALAYQEACSLATSLFKKHFSKDVEYASGKVTWGLCDTTAGVISQIDNMVCGLVEPAAQATLTIKPLQWSDEREPSEDVRYNHVVAESPLGRITVEWKGWKKYDSRCVYVGGEYIDSGSTLEEAKKIAERHLQNVVEALTTPAQAGWCKDCNPDNCCGCATPAAPAQVGEYPELPPLQVRYDGLGHTTTTGYGESQMRDYADATCAARGVALAALKHPAVKSDMLVNGGALKLALNVLRRAGKNEVADELECTAQAAPVDAERYRWLFDARTKSQAESFSGTVNNPLPQDVVLSHLHCFLRTRRRPMK